MEWSVWPKDEMWFLRVCHHISNAVYTARTASVTRPSRLVVTPCFLLSSSILVARTRTVFIYYRLHRQFPSSTVFRISEKVNSRQCSFHIISPQKIPSETNFQIIKMEFYTKHKTENYLSDARLGFAAG